MPKVRIEDTLPSGERVSLSIEGPDVSEEKVLHFLRVLREMRDAGSAEAGSSYEEPVSLKDKIWRVIAENFGDGTWFSLKDLYNIAAKEIPGLKITAVSTYVSRLISENKLVKRGHKPNTRYRVRVIIRPA
uniref:Uncharacterized protein n=1 Tax=Thermofilum pendens TaxID=2269 RepID=A0A7C4GZV5_THEPE